jgi:hypothetical protein
VESDGVSDDSADGEEVRKARPRFEIRVSVSQADCGCASRDADGITFQGSSSAMRLTG